MMRHTGMRVTRSAARQARGAHFPRGVVRAVAAPYKAAPSNGVKPRNIPSDIKEILFDEEQLAQRVRELARDIARDYQGKDLVVVGVLKGAFVFMSDLTRAIAEEGIPNVAIDFIRAASYGAGSVSNGSVDVDLCGSSGGRWAGRDVLVVEDIIDSGNTLSRLAREMADCGTASVKVIALLDKKGRRQVDFDADYVGFDIPADAFIVGMGMDFNETYRCLPYVAVLKPEVYS